MNQEDAEKTPQTAVKYPHIPLEIVPTASTMPVKHQYRYEPPRSRLNTVHVEEKETYVEFQDIEQSEGIDIDRIIANALTGTVYVIAWLLSSAFYICMLIAQFIVFAIVRSLQALVNRLSKPPRCEVSNNDRPKDKTNVNIVNVNIYNN